MSKLSGATGVTAIVSARIYNLQAPSSVTYPYLIFYQASGVIPNITPSDMLNHVYRVESRDTNRAGAATLHLAVYAALHKQTLTITGWTNYWTHLENEQRFIDQLSAQQFWRFIWDVRIKADKN